MSYPEPSFRVKVDVTNPGQFFACCGLLELAHRVWRGAEGWFHEGYLLVAGCAEHEHAITQLVRNVVQCDVSGLTDFEREELKSLERAKRESGKEGQDLTTEQEERRLQLGRQAREGDIRIGTPFNLALDWWNETNEESTPKTWAGRQEIHKVVRAAQDAIGNAPDLSDLLNYSCVLRPTAEYHDSASKKVEPFYFDSRRFAHRLDTGFSIDALKIETTAFPAVELLCLIGLQRFRPVPTPDDRWSFDYWTWQVPLTPPVAAATVSGVCQFHGNRKYRFRLRFRDDEKRYKAFGKARLMEVNHG